MGEKLLLQQQWTCTVLDRELTMLDHEQKWQGHQLPVFGMQCHMTATLSPGSPAMLLPLLRNMPKDPQFYLDFVAPE